MRAKFIRGTGVALVTPFKKDGKIDYLALERLINHVIDNGVNYLVSLGTTGETPTLTSDEKLDILNFTIEKNNGRVPIVAGIGGNNTAEILSNYTKYPMDKIQGVLSVSPFYNKPSQEGIFQHFKAVCEASSVPVILYNVPGRTGSNMTADTIVRIAKDCPNAVAIKDACGNIVQNMMVVKNAPEGFAVLSGDDDLVLPQIAIGVQGVISVAANCYTKDFCQMVQLALDNNFEASKIICYKYLPGINLLFTDGNPPGVKYVLSKMGLIENNFRLPVVPVSDQVASDLDKFMGSLS
jgi:4-hydroxy-tetrahydrodipicolinate synthase